MARVMNTVRKLRWVNLEPSENLPRARSRAREVGASARFWNPTANSPGKPFGPVPSQVQIRHLAGFGFITLVKLRAKREDGKCPRGGV